MTDSQLDEIFKKQLPGHESPVQEDMWGRIIRKKDRDRRGFFFFFTLAGLFILGFVTAGILLFNIKKRETVREKSAISHSTAHSGSDIPKPAATAPYLKKDSSINSEAAGRGVSGLQKTSMHKDYVKKTGSSEYRIAAIHQMQTKAKSKFTGNDQKKATSDSRSDLSVNAESKNSGTISEDTGKRSDQKTNPAVLSTPKLLNADSTKNNTVKKQDSTKNSFVKKWSLDLYASPDYPIDYSEPYVKSKLSYTVGLRVTRYFGKRFSGTIGIQFSRLNFNFIDSFQRTGPNHLMSIDLPVLAGYSLGNKTFGMTVNTGVVFNLYSWPGKDSINNSADYFKTNTGLSLYLGFHLEKEINERLNIFAEPYYRYRLSSMTVSSVYFFKFIDVAGITFGVRYYLK